MLGQKYNDLLKYKKLGNKSMGDVSKLGGKFHMPSRRDFHLLKEHDSGSSPVKVALHDNSDIGFNIKKSHLEKARHETHLMKSV